MELKRIVGETLIYAGWKEPEADLPAEWMQQHAEALDPSPAFIAASRKRLVRRINEETRRKAVRYMAHTVTRLLQDPRSLRVALAALLLTIVFAGRTFALASVTAIPGDALYPVKTALEHLRLAATFSQGGDARLRVEYSQRRLQEMESLALEGRFEYIKETAYDFEIQINSAFMLVDQIQRRDPNLAQALGDSIALTLINQTQALAALQYMVPTNDRDGIQLTLRKSNESLNSLRREINRSNPNAPIS